MVRQFLSPPRIGRLFVIETKQFRHTWEIFQIIRKMSEADRRYEIVARLVYSEKI